MTGGALPKTSDAVADAVAWIMRDHTGYIGPDLGVGLHGCSVGVLTVGLDAPITLETPSHRKITARSFYAPARAAHRVVASEGGRILLLFAGSAGAPADRMDAAMQRHVGPFGVDHRGERGLITVCGRGGVDHEALQGITGPSSAERTADPRIEELIDEMRAHPSRIFRAEASAQRLGLSRSHFLHLFARHTGTTFRRYQQWSRVLHVVRGTTAGHDLTRCAADAGFASPSHLSDSFRQALGTTATTVFGSHIRFCFDDAPGRAA